MGTNIWVFDSPKNGERFIIDSDHAFMHCLLLEGDVTVKTYKYGAMPILAIGSSGAIKKLERNAVVSYHDGRQAWWIFRRSKRDQSDAENKFNEIVNIQSSAARHEGVELEIRTEKHLKKYEILADNWLHLCAAMTRTRTITAVDETDYVVRQLNGFGVCTLGSLLDCDEMDPALVLSTIARLLQSGTVVAELDRERLGDKSVLQWRGEQP
jgi:hypothetical protein